MYRDIIINVLALGHQDSARGQCGELNEGINKLCTMSWTAGCQCVASVQGNIGSLHASRDPGHTSPTAHDSKSKVFQDWVNLPSECVVFIKEL